MPLLSRIRDVESTCDEDAKEILLVFYCPGCKTHHHYRIKGQSGQPVWEWNGSMEKPTFTPSLMVNKRFEESKCHLYVRDGMIEYLGDCHHSLKGQKIPMEESSW